MSNKGVLPEIPATGDDTLRPFVETEPAAVPPGDTPATVPIRAWRPVLKRADGLPTLSVAMIVRDEAATLGRCLASIANQVDEIVVVDTGSTDETKAIAARYTDRIADFTWVDDFAAARQYAFDLATGDWVLWLDADETLIGSERLRTIAAQADPSVTTIQWRTLMDTDDFGQPQMFFWRERMVRNTGQMRWVGRVHEVLQSSNSQPNEAIQTELVSALHHSDRTGAPVSDRNLRILQAVVAEAKRAGQAPEARTLFYLAREYADRGDARQAILTYEQYQSVATWADERYVAYLQAGRLHQQLAMYEFAIRAYFAAMELIPEWPLAPFALAETYYHLQAWPKVIHWVEIGRRLPPPATPLFIEPRALNHNWIIFYTHALWHEGRLEEAVWWTQFALGNDPDDQWHRANLRFFRSQLPVDYQRPLTLPRPSAAPRSRSDQSDSTAPLESD